MASDTRIVYTFVASGQQSVADAFQSIERAAKRSAKAVEQSTKDGATAQRSAATRVEREAERIAAAQKRAADKAADAQTKAAERSAAARVRAEERAYQQMTRAAERSWAQEQRGHERHQEQLRRQVERSAAAQARAQQKISDDRLRHWRGVGRDAAFSVAAAGLGVTTAFGGAVARDAFRMDDATNRLSINSRGAGQAFADPRQLQSEFRAVAVKTGTSSAELAEAVQKFVGATGRLDIGRNIAETVAYTAAATGANVGDVAQVAADLQKKFQINDIEAMQDAMAALAFQGKFGAFELRDAAAQFAKLGAAAASFGIGEGVDAVRLLGGLTQIARDASSSPEETATAVARMFDAIVKDSQKIKGEGVNVYDPQTGKLRDVPSILVEFIAAAGGNSKEKKSQKLLEIFDVMGKRAVNPMIARYNREYDTATGTDDQRRQTAMEALRRLIDDNVKAAGDWGEVLRDAHASQATLSAQLNSAWEKMMQDLAPIALEAMPAAAEAIKLAASSMTALAELLGYKRPESTHSQNAADLQAKAKGAATRLDQATAKDAPQPVIEKLKAEKEQYENAAAVESAKAMAPASAVFGPDMSEEEFQQKFAELGRKGGQSSWAASQLAKRATASVKGSASSGSFLDSIAMAPALWVTEAVRGKSLTSFGDVARMRDAYSLDQDATPEQKQMLERYGAQYAQTHGSDSVYRVGGLEFARFMDPNAPKGTSPTFDQTKVDEYNTKLAELTGKADAAKEAFSAAATAAGKLAEKMDLVKPPPAGGASTFIPGL